MYNLQKSASRQVHGQTPFLIHASAKSAKGTLCYLQQGLQKH